MPKFALALLLACLLLPSVAFSDELTPQKTADIKKLISLTKIDEAFLKMLNTQFDGSALVAIAESGAKITPEVQQAVAEVKRNVANEKVYGPGGLVDQFVPIYAENYTRKEIREQIRYYQTPLGKKIASTAISDAEKMSEFFFKFILSTNKEFTQRMQEALQEKGISPA